MSLALELSSHWYRTEFSPPDILKQWSESLYTDHSGYGLSQLEMTLKCNVIPYWLSPYPEWSLIVSAAQLCWHWCSYSLRPENKWNNGNLITFPGLHNFIFGLQTITHYISVWISQTISTFMLELVVWFMCVICITMRTNLPYTTQICTILVLKFWDEKLIKTFIGSLGLTCAGLVLQAPYLVQLCTLPP